MFLTQLKVVIWKKFVTRKRHWLLTILEFLMPIIAFSLFLHLITIGHDRRIPEMGEASLEDIDRHPDSLYYSFHHHLLLYSHRSEFYNDIINRTATKLKLDHDVKGFDSEEDLLKFYNREKPDHYIAIIFKGDNEKKLDYIIGADYFNNGAAAMAFLKMCLDSSFIEKIHGKYLEDNVQVLKDTFPHHPFLYSYYTMEYMMYLPFVILLAFVFLYPSILKCVVEEKQSGMKELMKMAGMQSWMLWLGWLLYGISSVVFTTIFITILIKCFPIGYPALIYTDGSIFVFFLLLFGMAAIAFCFAISSFFSRPSIAITVGVVIWITSYIVPWVLLYSVYIDQRLPWIVNILICLLPNMGTYYGCLEIHNYELRRVGVHWNNFYKPGSNAPNNLSMLNIYLMFIVDTVLYSLFTFYMDRVNPGKYGVRKHILYPIYYLTEIIERFFKKEFQLGNVPYETFDNTEVADGLQKGIEIWKLCKNFGDKLVVNNLNLNIYQNQITILLGHNGAGKTTTMSIITGMLSPTSGSVLFNGEDLTNNLNALRRSLGVCMQHNLFCTDFTVAEHLEFFAMLKGKTIAEAKEEVYFVLNLLKLFEKKDSRVDTLSGGMKRKLSLGMAIVGDSKVLILDEPTAGMDPESRREIWDLLLSWRESRTILLTTHFMEEADALGDWIAIMANGTLQCYGTPMYLKKKYDTGYHLSLMINGGSEEKEAVKSAIFRHIEHAKFRDSTGNNMVFILPFEHKIKITNLLAYLEDNKHFLKIENLSVTITTLEDVFLKAQMELESRITQDNSTNDLLSQALTTSKRSLLSLNCICLALIKKKAQFYKKKFFIFLLPVLLTWALLLTVTFSLKSVGRPTHKDAIKPLEPLDLKMYKDTEVYYNSPEDVIGAEVDHVSNLDMFYKKTVREYGGNPIEVDDVHKAIWNKGKENFIYRKEYLVAAATFRYDIAGTEIVALYNQDMPKFSSNALEISLHLVMNAVARTYLGEDYSISTSIWRERYLSSYSGFEGEPTALIAWYSAVPLGLLFVFANFMIFPHSERMTSFKHLQYMSGVTPWCYWITNFLSDFLVYLIIIIPVAAFLVLNGSQSISVFGTMIVLFVGCGVGCIPLTYLFSRKESLAGTYGLFISLGVFLTPILTVSLLLLDPDLNSHLESFHIFRALFMVPVPFLGLTYTVTRSIFSLMLRDARMSIILEDLILQVISGVLYLLINILVDVYFFRKLMYKGTNFSVRISSSGPVHIQEMRDNENYLHVDNLHKAFGRKHIVKGVSFTLTEGQCLGILGINGAGKTTTFRMLTREIIADRGSVEMVENRRHFNINQNEYLKKLGYCPQSDALNFALSARQILSLFASLRNLNQALVDIFLKIFELEKFADIPCGNYSGGNKRKLNLAVALLGYPKYVLLDEPTNGVDPSSRRKFWKLIRDIQENKKVSFILTSHSMVECEALCSYMKIMKAGEFAKEGTIGDLKRDIGGFSIKLKLIWRENVEANEKKKKRRASEEMELKTLRETSLGDTLAGVEELKLHFINKYGAEIKDEHYTMLHFYIKDRNKTWGVLFKEIESLKTENPHLIEDYVISEATLEDVFLSVAKSEEEGN